MMPANYAIQLRLYHPRCHTERDVLKGAMMQSSRKVCASRCNSSCMKESFFAKTQKLITCCEQEAKDGMLSASSLNHKTTP